MELCIRLSLDEWFSSTSSTYCGEIFFGRTVVQRTRANHKTQLTVLPEQVHGCKKVLRSTCVVPKTGYGRNRALRRQGTRTCIGNPLTQANADVPMDVSI